MNDHKAILELKIDLGATEYLEQYPWLYHRRAAAKVREASFYMSDRIPATCTVTGRRIRLDGTTGVRDATLIYSREYEGQPEHPANPYNAPRSG